LALAGVPSRRKKEVWTDRQAAKVTAILQGVPPALRGVPPAVRGVPPAVRGVPPALRGVAVRVGLRWTYKRSPLWASPQDVRDSLSTGRWAGIAP